MAMIIEEEFNYENDESTRFKHSLKLNDSNYIFTTKTHANMPLSRLDDVNQKRETIQKIKSYYDCLVEGSGLSDDGKYLLSLIIKKSFMSSQRAVYLSKREYLDLREITQANRYKFSDSLESAFEELHSTVFKFTRNGCLERYTFLEYSANRLGTDYYKAIISQSYIDLIISDNFFSKIPVRQFKQLKSDFIKSLHALICCSNFSAHNYLDVSHIGFSCAVNEKAGHKLNEKITRAFKTLQSLGVITDVDFVYKKTGKKDLSQVGYTVVSKAKSADEKKAIESKIEASVGEKTKKVIEPCIEDFDEEPVVTYRKEQTSPVLPIFTNSFDDLNDDDPLPF